VYNPVWVRELQNIEILMGANLQWVGFSEEDSEKTAYRPSEG
jgi:hypothetical protein